MIIEGLSEGLGLAQICQDTPKIAERAERQAQGEPEVDGLLAGVARLRQMREDTERLLEVPHSLAVGRPLHGLLPRLPAVYQGLVPHLPSQSMMSEAFKLLDHPVPGERFKGRDNAGMQYPPPLLQEAAVGHLLGEGVLEGVDQLGKQARLVQELGVLEMREAQAERLFRQLRHSLEEGQGHLGADDRRGLEQALLLRGQAVDARRQDGLHRGWYLNGRQGVRQAVGSRLAHQGTGLHQRPHALLQEEGIALGALDQQLGEGRQTRIVPHEGLEEGISAGRGQGVQPQLRVVGLAPPAVPVVRPVVDQQEQARRRQALDQAFEQRLGLRIQPVQILTDQQHGLPLALAQQHPLEGGERALAALRAHQAGGKDCPREGVEQRQERRERVVEGGVERAHLFRHLGLDGPRVLTLLQVVIAPQQVADREVGGGLAVGHRRAVEHQPALRVGVLDKLVHQARLPYPCLTHHRHHLAVSCPGLGQSRAEGSQFRLPPHKVGESTGSGNLQTPAPATDPE